MAACIFAATWSAMSFKPGSPVTSTSTWGFIASTITAPSSARSDRTTTLQGNSSPIWRSTLIAWCASGGLHAPRIRYSSMSSSSLAFSVAFTSISVSTPKACCARASRVRTTASSNVVCSVVDSAMSIRLGSSHLHVMSPTGGDVEFGVHARSVVASDVADQFVASSGKRCGGPACRLGRDAVAFVSAATARGFPKAASLVDLAVRTDDPLAGKLALRKRQHDQLVVQPPSVECSERHLTRRNGGRVNEDAVAVLPWAVWAVPTRTHHPRTHHAAHIGEGDVDHRTGQCRCRTRW